MAVDTYRNINVGSTGVSVTAAPTELTGYFLSNAAATDRYVRLYDKATAAASTDTPKLTLKIPASSAANISFPEKSAIAFSLGLSVRATTGVADNDTGAPTANDVIVNLFYK